MKRKYKVDVGDIFESKIFKGLFYEIIDVERRKGVGLQAKYTIMFLDDFKHTCVLVGHKTILKGTVTNPYSPSVYGKGYLGVGIHEASYVGTTKHTPVYECWIGMIERGYSELCKKRNPSYKDVLVCDEWHNFQVFADWYEINYPHELEKRLGGRLHLDKDLLVKGNKIYSPSTCIFLPNNINSYIASIEKRSTSDSNMPVGIYIRGSKFIAHLRDNEIGKRVQKTFNTIEEAVEWRDAMRHTCTLKVRDWMRSLNHYPEEVIQLI